LNRFDDVLAALRKNAKVGPQFVFEKAYSEYRLNRTDEALKTIRAVNEPDARTKELLGQVVRYGCYFVDKGLSWDSTFLKMGCLELMYFSDKW